MLALEQSQAKDLESESLEFLFVPFSAKAERSLVRNGCNLFVMGNGLRNLRQMGDVEMEKCVAIVSKESKGMHFNRVTTLEAGALS